jgi:hypothetical protein
LHAVCKSEHSRRDFTPVVESLLTFFFGICFAPSSVFPKQESVDRILRRGVRLSHEVMGTFDLVLLLSFWYMLKSVPGLMQFVGYFFGFTLASWAFDQYFRRN